MSDITDTPPETPAPKRNKGWFTPGDPRRSTGSNPRRTKDGKSLTKIAREYTEEAFNHILNTMRDETAPKKVRLDAASLVLTRGWGLANQQITIDGQVSHNHAPQIDPAMLSFEAREQILAAFNNAITVQPIEPTLIEAHPINKGENESD
jgi:hypothetical protein